MTHSIRFRFTLILIALMTVMLLTLWAINNQYLEAFYINQKVKALEEGYAQIDMIALQRLNEGSNLVDMVNEELAVQKRTDEQITWGRSLPEPNAVPREPRPESEREAKLPDAEEYEEETVLLKIVQELTEKNNVAFVMIDGNNGGTVRFSREGEWLAFKVQRYMLGQNAGNSEIIKTGENYTIERLYDFRNNSYYLESWGLFSDNRTLYIMSMPLASIEDSVELSNRFLTYVGFVTLLVGSILMYITTRTITLPIKKLAALSEEMSKLNFNAKYKGKAKDEIGTLGHSMNTLSDRLKETIGELKTANNELMKDIENKIQVDEARKEFIANVSHELKTPIALIQGYAEGLTEGMCEDEESRNYYCEVIVDEANKMNKMVRQLLNLTALEFGNDTTNMERFDVAELIRQLIASSHILIRQNEARVIIEAPETCYVWADEFKIEEVLTNYLNNAMNHLSGERLIIVRVEPLETEIKISVFNTGDAIPGADIPHLWTKFYKVDKAHTREYGGSGIGLSIVKAIMDAHNKEYGVENKDNGVEFFVMLDSADA